MCNIGYHREVREKESLGTIANLLKHFKIGKLLSQASIGKTKGAKPLEVFSIIFNLCFKG